MMKSVILISSFVVFLAISVKAQEEAEIDLPEEESPSSTVHLDPERVFKVLLRRSPCGPGIEPLNCTCKAGFVYDWPKPEERENVKALPCVDGAPAFCTCPDGKNFKPPKRALAAIERLIKNNVG